MPRIDLLALPCGRLLPFPPRRLLLLPRGDLTLLPPRRGLGRRERRQADRADEARLRRPGLALIALALRVRALIVLALIVLSAAPALIGPPPVSA